MQNTVKKKNVGVPELQLYIRLKKTAISNDLICRVLIFVK